MYKEQTFEIHIPGDIEFCKNSLFNVKLPEDFDWDEVSRMELWASSFSEPGPDYCEYRFFNKSGEMFFFQRQEGY